MAESARKKITGWLGRAWDFSLFALPYVLPPGASGVMAKFAIAADRPAYEVFLLALGAFGICSLALASIYYVIRHRSVFERLRYARTEPIIVNPDPQAGSIGVMFKAHLQNMSLTRSMYVSVNRADASLQGRVHPEPTLLNDVMIVPAFSEFAVSTAAVPDVDVSKEIKGKLEFEILYGPSPDNLCYMLSYQLDPRIDIKALTETNAQIIFSAPVKKYRHRRA
jgi:hypothetical protein